jgi:phage tail-like protein
MSDAFVAFRYRVNLYSTAVSPDPLCGGLFSEATGIEATMTPRTIREGGRNTGALQRVGPVAFGSVTLKRGMTRSSDLWRWLDLVAGRENFGIRLQGQIDVMDGAESNVVASWKLLNVLPIKFKAPDLSATSSQVAVEEVQLVFEDLSRDPT